MTTGGYVNQQQNVISGWRQAVHETPAELSQPYPSLRIQLRLSCRCGPLLEIERTHAVLFIVKSRMRHHMPLRFLQSHDYSPSGSPCGELINKRDHESSQRIFGLHNLSIARDGDLSSPNSMLSVFLDHLGKSGIQIGSFADFSRVNSGCQVTVLRIYFAPVTPQPLPKFRFTKYSQNRVCYYTAIARAVNDSIQLNPKCMTIHAYDWKASLGNSAGDDRQENFWF
jgi:hypothetical protein